MVNNVSSLQIFFDSKFYVRILVNFFWWFIVAVLCSVYEFISKANVLGLSKFKEFVTVESGILLVISAVVVLRYSR